MRIALLFLVVVAVSAMAQPSTDKTVREVAVHVAMTVTRLELSACRTAHPSHAESFSASLVAVEAKLNKALDDMRPQRAQDLMQPVPAAVLISQDMIAALHNSESRERPLEGCLKAAREIVGVTDQEAAGLMNAMVTTLLTASASYRQGLQQVLR
jgi:hypothetical protein